MSNDELTLEPILLGGVIMNVKKFTKPPDWKDLEQKWLENYDDVNYNKSLSQVVLERTHSLIETDKNLKKIYPVTLEVGVGTMAHFKHVRHSFDKYIASDHDPKVIDILRKHKWPEKVEIQHLKGGELPFEDNSIDRIIATHVLEHVPQPVKVLEEWVRVMIPGGVLSLILPCDPGFAWRFGRNFGPRSDGTKAGIPYDYYMACEHINSIFSLKEIIKFHFPERVEIYWPFRVPSPNLNLIYAVNCYI